MVNNFPKVSIIISTFNRAKYLPSTIESALAQDYPNLEVVVFDALSTDDTPEIVKRYHDARLKYFRHKEKLSAHHAIRTALYEHSTGDWVAIMSDDDYFISGSYISNAIRLAQKDDKTIFVHANYFYYFENSGTYLEIRQHLPEIVDGKWYFLNWGDDQRKIQSPGGKAQPSTPKSRHPSSQNSLPVLDSGPLKPWIEICMINRQLLGDIVLYNSEIASCDYADLLRMSLLGKVGFINDVVGVFRAHDSSVNVHRSLEKVIENFQCIEIPYEYAKHNKLLPSNELELWKRKKIKYFCNDMINIFAFKRNNGDMLKGIVGKMKKDYPFALIVFLYPRNIIKLLLFKFPSIYRKFEKLYQMVRYRDIAGDNRWVKL